MDDPVTVFRTGSLVEFDCVTCALKDAGVPYFTRGESVSGLRLATLAAPSVGPGTFWVVIVPRVAADDARSILAQFPFADKTNPGVWDFQPPPRAKLWWKIYIWGILIVIVLSALWNLIEKLT